MKGLKLAIDFLSPQLTKNLVTAVIDVVNDTNILSTVLEFEIIENSLITQL